MIFFLLSLLHHVYFYASYVYRTVESDWLICFTGQFATVQNICLILTSGLYFVFFSSLARLFVAIWP